MTDTSSSFIATSTKMNKDLWTEQTSRKEDSSWIGQCQMDELETIKQTIGHISFKNFANEAYASELGYSIRNNPVTGKREMFVAGTRDLQQWALNIYDGMLHHYGFGSMQILDPWRYEKQNILGKIARNERVDIVYGHSRGAALAADMPLGGCIQRIGVNGAMRLAANKKMVNLYEGGGLNPLGLFDQYIAQTGENNHTFDLSPWSPHKVWEPGNNTISQTTKQNE